MFFLTMSLQLTGMLIVQILKVDCFLWLAVSVAADARYNFAFDTAEREENWRLATWRLPGGNFPPVDEAQAQLLSFSHSHKFDTLTMPKFFKPTCSRTGNATQTKQIIFFSHA